jgi:acetylornithine/succinyldiaminopimelate/putrescine aminotransferase
VRVQPPLVISREQIDRALEVFENALAEITTEKQSHSQSAATASER